MHLIKDENGNPVQHGHEHEHSHSTECQGHSHEHCGSCQDGNCQNETVALLTYMLQHNEHHAQELDQMAERRLGKLFLISRKEICGWDLP